ncbi:MAG: hypothetical protein FWG39_03150, partial [Alphaproteobacteria bacterium]|nr:hypothetical protein [Alphaproteobacteria bacterium]
SLAAARMAAANEQMRRAAETIAETEISINNGHSSIKQLKEKLSNLKSKVGREPTKESAAKILRAQAKMEQVTEKLKRAELRLRRARRRLADAENDAGLARAQIAAGPLYENEPKVNDMSEEVKPLFTKDPEIMDERIAFKPIEFGPSAAPAPQQPEFVAPPLNLTPTSPFAQASGDRPRTPAESFEGRAEYQPAQPAYAPAPVAPTFAKAPAGEPERSAGAPPMSPPPPMSPTRADFMANRPEPMTDEPIKITSGAGRSGPSAMYYVMLVLLIILSVLTLWLYQNRMTAGIPDILQPVASEQQTAGTQKSGLRATFGKMFEKSAPAQPAIPEPVVRPAPELADVDSAFLDEDGFMRPVTLPAQIPGDMPPVAIRCLAECSPQCDSMHEGCPGYDAWVNGTYEEWQEQQSAEYNEPVFGPAIEPEYTEAAEVFEEYEEPAAIMCEDGSAPYEDGCCGDEILTDLAGFGPACCPGGVEDKKDCKVPVR